MFACLPATWEALSWLHRMAWYKEMLRASWFSPILPYWRDYHLDWVALLFTLLLLFFFLKAIFGRKVKVSRGRAGARKQRKLALKAAEHYLQAGEKMMAADAFIAAARAEKALELLVEMKAWSRAGVLAEQMGRVDDAIEYFRQAEDFASVVRLLQKSGRVEEAAREYEKHDRLVDAAKLYLAEGRQGEAAELYMRVGMFGKAAELFFEKGERKSAIECLERLMSGARAGLTEDECALLVQGAGVLYKEKKLLDSARMLEAAGQTEGAAKRYESCGARSEAAGCYEKLGKFRRAVDLTDDPQKRLALLEKMQREGQHVDEAQMAKALSEAGQHEDAVELFLKMGDREAAVRHSIEAGDSFGAAKILMEQGKHLEAARLFADAGDLESSRKQYLLAGDRMSAAKIAEDMDLYLVAGKEFFSLGKYEDAVRSLQKIDESDPDYRLGSSILGNVFAAMGDGQIAMRMHKRATSNLGLKKNTLELFYNMARFLEAQKSGNPASQAREIYTRILEVDYGFKDVKERIKLLD